MISRILALPLILFVKAWRKVASPSYGQVCKFHPTCSEYGLEALERHGAFRGTWLMVSRIARCHPWSAGGVDYVPGSPAAQQWANQVSNQPSGRKPRSTTEVAS